MNTNNFKRKLFLTFVLLPFYLIFSGNIYASDATADIQAVTIAAGNSSYSAGGNTYTFGNGNDLSLTGVTGVSGFQYNLTPLTSRVVLNRVDNAAVAGGPRSRIFTERSGGAGTFNFEGSLPGTPGNVSMEEVLGGTIINRGALDLFLNVDTGGELAGNIERVDYIFDAGIQAP